MFFDAEKVSSTDHDNAAFHHKFTTIYHHTAPQNSPKPLKNGTSTTAEKKRKNPTSQGFGRVTQSSG